MTSNARQRRARKERERARKRGCRTGKIPYPDRIAASRALARMGTKQRGEIRTYWCGLCGSLHLTSRI